VGADVIFVEAPRDESEIERIAAAIDAPLLVNMVPGGSTPAVGHERLAELGFRIVIHPIDVLLATVPVAVQALNRLRGSQTAGSQGQLNGPAALFELFGLADWQRLGDRYDGGG
jgi:2-methylisocitrate lyase-like PEP mutase family enzyme